jgi:PhnB protein
MSVVPYLTIPSGRASEAAEFYKNLFGATETLRMPAEDKTKLLHCALQFAGGSLFLCDNFRGQTQPQMTAVFVGLGKPADVDATIAKAKAAGATITREPEDVFWGDRFAQFVDPFGHEWQVGASKG